MKQDRYMMFQKSGFNVITRDENRSIDETFALVESMFGLNEKSNPPAMLGRME